MVSTQRNDITIPLTSGREPDWNLPFNGIEQQKKKIAWHSSQSWRGNCTIITPPSAVETRRKKALICLNISPISGENERRTETTDSVLVVRLTYPRKVCVKDSEHLATLTNIRVNRRSQHDSGDEVPFISISQNPSAASRFSRSSLEAKLSFLQVCPDC